MKFPFEHIFTARKRSLGQGNIFAPVCHSVHGGGCLLPGGGGVLAPGGSGPGGMHAQGGACFGGVLLAEGVPTSPRTATAAGGTHPTGMHSCGL